MMSFRIVWQNWNYKKKKSQDTARIILADKLALKPYIHISVLYVLSYIRTMLRIVQFRIAIFLVDTVIFVRGT